MGPNLHHSMKRVRCPSRDTGSCQPEAATLGGENTYETYQFENLSIRTAGMVDISWIPVLHRTAVIKQHTGYDFLLDYPKIQNWREALLETGLGEGSVPEDFEDVFTDFYLDDETYLGGLARRQSAPIVGVPN